MFFTDQLHRTITLSRIPERIISLVPSQTELLFDLGLEDRIIGVTKFCVHPASVRLTKAIIGGTKNLQIEKIRSLQPDLIIANKEENERDQIELLAAEIPVWISDINTIEAALDMISKMGAITQKEQRAAQIVQSINLSMEALTTQVQNQHSAIYLIWRNPWMSAGADTFIHAMMKKAGLVNICESLLRYPDLGGDLHLAMAEQQLSTPGLILLSSEPYPFKQHHVEELRRQFPASRVILVDGEAFSWYGSRMVHSFQYLKALLYEISAEPA